MAATLTELVTSRERSTGDRPHAELHYQVRGTAEDGAVKTILTTGTPGTFDGLVRESIHFEPAWADTVTQDGLWDCRVRYVAPERREPQAGDEAAFAFDTSGGTQHVTQSIQTIGRHAPAGQTAPDFQGAIGVTADSVEGVEITIPVYSFSETHYIHHSHITAAYKGTLFSLTGKVNSAAFRGLAAGECLFLGASGSKRGDTWEITYRFAASPNQTNLVIGDITVPAKKGWEYLWVRYADAEDEASNTLVQRPVAAYVEKVYEEADFGGLDLE